MKNIAKVSESVEHILRTMPFTRASDDALYIEICKKYNPDVQYMGFTFVFENINMLHLPKYETVRRCRQKLLETHEELRPTEEVVDGRYENYKEVKKYVSKF